jgi:hypothetical protein
MLGEELTMTTQQWKEAIGARPFLPFTVRTGDGREFQVSHPEMAWATPGGRVVFVATTPDSAAAIDLLLVTSLEPVGLGTGRAGQGPPPADAPA